MEGQKMGHQSYQFPDVFQMGCNCDCFLHIFWVPLEVEKSAVQWAERRVNARENPAIKTSEHIGVELDGRRTCPRHQRGSE